MGFLKGLLGLGVTAGAAFAALKVAQKYEENKAADAAAAAAGAEPQDVPAGSVLEDIARAAGGVLSDAGAKVKEVVTGTAEKAGVDTVELKGRCTTPETRCMKRATRWRTLARRLPDMWLRRLLPLRAVCATARRTCWSA